MENFYFRFKKVNGVFTSTKTCNVGTRLINSLMKYDYIQLVNSKTGNVFVIEYSRNNAIEHIVSSSDLHSTTICSSREEVVDTVVDYTERLTKTVQEVEPTKPTENAEKVDLVKQIEEVNSYSADNIPWDKILNGVYFADKSKLQGNVKLDSMLSRVREYERIRSDYFDNIKNDDILDKKLIELQKISRHDRNSLVEYLAKIGDIDIDLSLTIVSGIETLFFNSFEKKVEENTDQEVYYNVLWTDKECDHSTEFSDVGYNVVTSLMNYGKIMLFQIPTFENLTIECVKNEVGAYQVIIDNKVVGVGYYPWEISKLLITIMNDFMVDCMFQYNGMIIQYHSDKFELSSFRGGTTEKIKFFLENGETVTVKFNGVNYDISLIKTSNTIMCKQVGYIEKYNNDKAYSQICAIIMIISERCKTICDMKKLSL